MLATSAFNREPMQVGHLFEVNPLTPKSDELLILPYNITLESNIKVTRIHDQGNDHLLKKLLIVKKILHLRNCIENSMENVLTDL